MARAPSMTLPGRPRPLWWLPFLALQCQLGLPSHALRPAELEHHGPGALPLPHIPHPGGGGPTHHALNALGAGAIRVLEERDPSRPWMLAQDRLGVEGALQHLRRGVDTNLEHARAGQAYPASTLAWMRLKAKIESGAPISVAGVGSSVLGVQGGCTVSPRLSQQCGSCCFPMASAPPMVMDGPVANFGAGWARIGFDYLLHLQGLARLRRESSNDPAQASGDVNGTASELLNYARPGGGAQTFNGCLDKWAPTAGVSDLVLLELNVIGMADEAEEGARTLQEIEGLVRQLLGKPRPPAVMLVDFFQWCWAVRGLCGPGGEVDPAALQDLSGIFQGTGKLDANIRALGRHYSVPVLSHLHALWPIIFPSVDLLDATQPGHLSGLTEPPPRIAEWFRGDGIHPNQEGNEVFGPVLALALSEALAATPSPTSLPHAHASSALGPEPLFAPQYRLPPVSICYDFIDPDLNSIDPGGELREGGQGLDPEHVRSLPAHTMSFMAFRNPAPIARSSGFVYEEFVNAADGSERFKPGVLALGPGAFLEMSHLVPKEHRSPTASPQVCLAYMSSWHELGQASLSCSGACGCLKLTLNGHNQDGHTVEASTCHPLQIAQEGQAVLGAENCTVRLDVLPSAGHGDRFKVTTLSFHTAPAECATCYIIS